MSEVISLTVALPTELFVHIDLKIIFKKMLYCIIRKLGLGEILTKHAVDNFLLGSIQTKL